MKPWLLFLPFLLLNCQSEPAQNEVSADVREIEPEQASSIGLVNWSDVDSINVDQINSDVKPGVATIDVGIYFPANFDTSFHKVTLSRLLESFVAAKEIFQPTQVQLNLLWVKTGDVDPRYFSMQANKVPQVPSTEYVNMYEHMRRHPAQPTELTLEAFSKIIEPNPENDRRIFLLALQDVFYPFLEVAEGRNWMIKSVRTGGLSFPTYSYVNTLPPAHRGIITITNLQRQDRYRRTVAHEIGHKAMNVSHEYRETNPGHEIFAEGGLMLYGQGEEIPSGAAGRWHLERLQRSPFVYVQQEDGSKQWNPDYQEGGHYYDPIYGDYVIHFPGVAPIDEDW